LEITVLFLGIHKWEPEINIGFSLALHLQCSIPEKKTPEYFQHPLADIGLAEKCKNLYFVKIEECESAKMIFKSSFY
jgi:hypothetical protein